MLIVHSNWSQGALHLWAEEVARLREPASACALEPGRAAWHPFAAGAERVAGLLERVSPGTAGKAGVLEMVLPALGDAPAPSPEAAHAVGQAVALETDAPPVAQRFSVPAVAIVPEDAA
jgi:hypothetical protein